MVVTAKNLPLPMFLREHLQHWYGGALIVNYLLIGNCRVQCSVYWASVCVIVKAVGLNFSKSFNRVSHSFFCFHSLVFLVCSVSLFLFFPCSCTKARIQKPFIFIYICIYIYIYLQTKHCFDLQGLVSATD